MPIATLTSKGQTTIPKEIRNRLGLTPGDKLDFVIEGDGRVVLRPATLDVRELRGMLSSRFPVRIPRSDSDCCSPFCAMGNSNRNGEYKCEPGT